jgi:hypothetical protein
LGLQPSLPQTSLSDFKLRIDRNLHRCDEMIGLARQSDNLDQRGVLRICHATRPRRRRMRMNAIGAAVRSRHRDVDDLAHGRVERALDPS